VRWAAHVRSRLFFAGFLLMAGFATAPAQADKGSSYVNFSFDQVDIRLLVKLVGEMTGKRFVIDNSVAGKVTIVSPPQIPVDEVYPLFLSVLESTGYSVVEQNGVCNVVALPERGIASAPVVSDGDQGRREGIITKVIKVEYIGALELKKVLEPMVRGGKTGALSAFGPTSHLIITDTSENIKRIEQIIGKLDKPGSARVVEFVKLEHAPAEEVAAQLTAAIRGMETADKSLSRHIQQVAEGAGSTPSDVVVVPAPGANSIVLVGTTVQIAEIKRIALMMDVEASSGYGRLNAIFLRYLSAEEAAKSLNALLAKSVVKDQRQRIALEPSVANNALIVDAAPKDFEYVRSLVEQLDQVPQQVLVEILIVEVNLGKSLDLGVEWSTVDIPTKGKTTAIGRSNLANTDAITELATKAVFPQGLALGIAKGTYTDSSGNVYPNIPLLIQALAQNRDVTILSNVPLLAQNNTEASVSVVDNIPILKSTVEGGAGTARDVIQNIDRVDVGMKLKFTPHVNPNRDVTMQLSPSIEAIIDEGEAGKYTPTIAKREVTTTLTVPNKATVVISGLIREDTIKTVSKIPILGDIPLLGILFRKTSDQKQRTNLLIFVTPHIVTDIQEAAKMKDLLIGRTGLDISPTNLNTKSSSRR
jgi:general secretion pathway protein D